jgi:hypothetical protein
MTPTQAHAVLTESLLAGRRSPSAADPQKPCGMDVDPNCDIGGPGAPMGGRAVIDDSDLMDEAEITRGGPDAFAARRLHDRGRHIVKIGDVRLALPHRWTRKLWSEATVGRRASVFNICTSFRTFLLQCYLPFKSEQKGEISPDVLPQFMADFCDEIQRRVHPELLPFDHPEYDPDLPWRVCQVWPTGCFKSSLVEAFESWIIGVNPDVTLLPTLATKELGERFVRFHTANFERNEMYNFVFGSLDPPGTRDRRVWRQDQFAVERPLNSEFPTLSLLGYQGNAEGLRADIALVDDIEDFQNCKTDTARQEKWTWLSQVLEARLHPRRRLLWMIGTLHEVGDVYHRARDEAQATGTWSYSELPLISDAEIERGHWPPRRVDPTKTLSMSNVIVPRKLVTLWPEFITPEAVVSRYVNNPSTWYKTQQHRITDPEGESLSEEELDECFTEALPLWNRGVPTEGSTAALAYEAMGLRFNDLYVLGDLAATEKVRGKDPDATVFQLWAVCVNSGRHVCLDQHRFHSGDGGTTMKNLVEFVEPYLKWVARVALESQEAVDKFYLQEVDAYVRQRLGIGIASMSLKSEKEDLVNSLLRLFRERRIIVPYLAEPHTVREMTPFRNELLAYKHNGKGHDDTVITAAHHMRFCSNVDGEGVTAKLVGVKEREEPGHRLLVVAAEELEDGGFNEFRRATLKKHSEDVAVMAG